MTKLFENNSWEATKEALCEGVDLQRNMDGSRNDSKKQIFETLLNNTHNEMTRLHGSNYLMENASAGSTGSTNIASINRVILPVIRRVMPTVIANEIVGVQPMTGPVAQVHTLRVGYAETHAGVTAGTEALSPFDIAKYYGDMGASGLNTPPSPIGSTARNEGVAGKKLDIQVLKETVKAETRRLSARWTIEAQQDAQSQQGIDLEAELMAALAQEITSEIDQTILARLRALPGSVAATYDQAAVSGTATFVGDEFAALAVLINREANNIAVRTRRGPANWAVVSNTALTILQSARTSAFARTTEGTFDAPTNTKYVGTLNNSMRIYVDAYANEDTPILIGYKGKGETDAAAYYCPYVPLTSMGAIPDPNTMEMVTSFFTRFGFLTFTNSANSFGNSADYLSTIGLTNLSFM